MTTAGAWIKVAACNQFFFSNTLSNDLIIYTGLPTQNILFGTSNTTSILTLRSNVIIPAANIVPSSNNTFSLGTSNLRFKDLYIGSNSLFLGNTKFSCDSSGTVALTDSVTGFNQGITVQQIQLGSVSNSVILTYNSNNNQLLLNTYSNGSLTGQASAGAGWSNNSSNVFIFNSNVGIGKSNPAYPLDVTGDLNFTGILRQSGLPYVGSQWSNNSSNVFLLSSNVGIGKSNPTYPLDVTGDLNFTGILRQGGVPYVGSQWSNNSSNVFLLNSNVGIGKSNPVYPLDVTGDINFANGAFRSNGNIVLFGAGWSNNSSNVFLLNSNVGIGKSNPQYSLDINGPFNVNSLQNTSSPITVPPVAINGQTLTNGGITYTFSNAGGNGLFSGWLFDRIATVTYFDALGTYNATTGIYGGTAPSTNGITGAWFQIQTTQSWIMTSYTLTLLTSNFLKKWYIFGSSNGTTWTQIELQSLSSWTFSSTPTTFNIVNSTAFTYYRFVINLSDGVTVPAINEVLFNGTLTAQNYNTLLYASNYVGIYQSNPAYPLDVTGDINFTGILRQSGLPYVGSQWSNNSNNVFLLNSNVGLGLNNPQAQLHISSNLRVDGSITIMNPIQVGGITLNTTGGSGSTSIVATTSNILGWSNTSNGITLSIASNTSNYKFSFLASSNEILKIQGDGNIVLPNRLQLNGLMITQRQSTLINNITSAVPIVTTPIGGTQINTLCNTTVTTGSNTSALSNIIDSSSNWVTLCNLGTMSVINSAPNSYYNSNASIDIGRGYFQFSNNGSLFASSNIAHSNIISTSFTIESWVYYYNKPISALTSLPYFPSLIGMISPSNSQQGWVFGVTSNMQLSFGCFANYSVVCAVYTQCNLIPLNTWTHIGASYTTNNSNLQLFVNGVTQSNLIVVSPWITSNSSATLAYHTSISSIGNSLVNNLLIGQYSNINNPCYIHDLRMTTGVAYTPSNPPIVPLSTPVGTRLLLRGGQVNLSPYNPISIVPNGNIGINNINPLSTLDVNGDINFTGTLKKGQIIYPQVSVLQYITIGSNNTPPLQAINADYPLNSIAENDLNLVLLNNTWTLTSGTYEIYGSLPSIGTSRYRTYLFNITDNSIQKVGTTPWDGVQTTNSGVSIPSIIYNKFTLTSSKTYKIKTHTNGATWSPGAGSYDEVNIDDIYAQIIIKRLA